MSRAATPSVLALLIAAMELVQYHADMHHLRIFLIFNRNKLATDSVSINICRINFSANMIIDVKHPPIYSNTTIYQLCRYSLVLGIFSITNLRSTGNKKITLLGSYRVTNGHLCFAYPQCGASNG
jgi:hypothetical protein